jgi:hypothetical protein
MGDFLSCNAFAARTGYRRQTINFLCLRHRGFGFQAGPRGRWRIPSAHVGRLLRGESVAEIAAAPSIAEPPLGLSPKTQKWMEEGAADAPG